jgi:hypothetical protein
MSELVAAIGWFIAFAAVGAAVCAIVWQMEPRPVDKAGGAPPAHH